MTAFRFSKPQLIVLNASRQFHIPDVRQASEDFSGAKRIQDSQINVFVAL